MSSEANLLVQVLSYLDEKNGRHLRTTASSNPVLQSIASAAAGILATAAPNFATLGPDTPQLDATLRQWSAGTFDQMYVQHPQLTAAVLLWADTWKRGS